MKKKLKNTFFILLFVMGLCILIYPFVSDFIESLKHDDAVIHYVEQVNEMSEKDYQELLSEAKKYNDYISQYNTIILAQRAESTFDCKPYEELLNLGNLGVLTIPSINVELPIYHGTDESSLQAGVGHYKGSSLPIGGASTHCVLTGHTGLPSSRLLTDIDQLEEGDIFYIRILKDTLAYEVNQIKVVLPEELNDINIVQGEDYCTLVTCTPYGINSHRLLVRGKRIAYVDLSSDIGSELQILPMFITALVTIMLYMIISLIRNKFRKKG